MILTWSLTIYYIVQKNIRRDENPRGVVVHLLTCDIAVSEFNPQSHSHIVNPPHPSYVPYSTTSITRQE